MKKNLLIQLLICLTLAACSPAVPINDPSSSEVPPKLTATMELPTVQPDPSFRGFSVIDALGREVKFSQTPVRIALAGRGSTLVIDALYLFPEARERLVTIGKGSQGPENFVGLIDPKLGDKPVLPPDVSPEQLAALKPDGVILKSYNSEKLGTPLESLGIPVVYVDFETPDQYWRDLASLGKVFQNEPRAEEIISYYKNRLAVVEKGLAGLEETKKPRQLLLYYSAKDGEVAFNVAPAGYIQTLMIKMAGGVPVWTEMQLEKGWTKVSFEQIAVWDADQIFIVDYTGNVDEVVEGLKADSNWQQLRAIKDSMIFAFPKDFVSWDQADPRWVLGLMWMAKTTYPDRFTELDIEKEARLFFEKMYGINEDGFVKSIEPKIIGNYK